MTSYYDQLIGVCKSVGLNGIVVFNLIFKKRRSIIGYVNLKLKTFESDFFDLSN